MLSSNQAIAFFDALPVFAAGLAKCSRIVSAVPDESVSK
jgi:hypothetical protein